MSASGTGASKRTFNGAGTGQGKRQGERVAISAFPDETLRFAALTARAYGTLAARRDADAELGLGGKLFYAGELDGTGRALLVAANIAGAATLAVTADREAQKQAIRDGVADFVVTSLDEALRIVKNQLRKREPVAVCAALERAAAEREMSERGVAPDLARDGLPTGTDWAMRAVEGDGNAPAPEDAATLVVWRAETARPRDLAALDETALDCAGANNWAARRWLRLAPRYVGRMAEGAHWAEMRGAAATRFFQQARARAERGEIGSGCEIGAYAYGAESKRG